MSGTFEDLRVWQLAMKLVFSVYEVTLRFPKDELYGLVSQMRRAAVSIASNIAEGKGRASDKDFALFLGHARGSLHELHTQILISKHLRYISADQGNELLQGVDDVGRMLAGLLGFATKKPNLPAANRV